MSGTAEVEAFLSEIGLESCIQAVVHNGFNGMEAASDNVLVAPMTGTVVRVSGRKREPPPAG
jgi:hypothetical protein